MPDTPGENGWIGWAVGVGGLLLALATRLFAGGRWVGRNELREKDLRELEERVIAQMKLHVHEVTQETRHLLRNEIQRAQSERYISLDDRLKRLEEQRDRRPR